MKKSIITNDMCHCYVCGTTRNIEKHHVIFGTANRKKSDQDGLVVPLCHYHHTGSNKAVHLNRGLDLKLKQIAERKWLEYYDATVDEWIKRFGKNYI